MKKLTELKNPVASYRALQDRVTALEAEVQECRALNLRMAELTDIMTELVLPIAQRDEAKLGELIDRYQKDL